jgi:pyridoxal phosphate enzyme (YggS family)
VTEITDHLAQIIERVARAALRSGRSANDVTVVAISKQQSPRAIAEVAACGVRDIGESYVQEALAKIAALTAEKITWHFVGRLQSNKTRAVAEHFDWVHTLDRARIAERLAEQRPRFAPPLNVLIQVNQGDESQKAGVAPTEVKALAEAVLSLPRLRLRGLMTLPPQACAPEQWFADLAQLQRQLVSAGIPLDKLSMGMSADFEAAIAAGANLVRIGTSIFGARVPV